MCEQVRAISDKMDARLPSEIKKNHLINLQPVSGLRALVCLGVLIGHCMFWVVGSAADKMQVYQLLDKHSWVTGLMKMPQVFMDTFLVLTGFLAAQSLLPGLSAAPGYFTYIRRQVTNLDRCSFRTILFYPLAARLPVTENKIARRYYTSRFARIAPSLYSMLAIVYLVVLPAIAADLISADARSA